MLFPTTAAERDALEYCLVAYLDNQADKGLEGIGTDLLDVLIEWLELCRAGGDAPLVVNLLQLAHIQKALDTYQEDEGVDQAVVSGLLGRIERAYPLVIPASP